jgi:cephalosporin hydroxylase
MNDLEKFFYETEHKRIHKWRNYFQIYAQHFERFRGKKINILEIGVAHGGSIDMWISYFGKDCTVYCVDIDPQCKKFEGERVKVYIGSQGDPEFLFWLTTQCPMWDIVIDDGSHRMKDQIMSFDWLFRHVKNGGIYLTEDVHTSFIRHFGGNRRMTFLNYCKNLVDELYGWQRNRVSSLSRSIKSIHFHTGIVVIEKDEVNPPEHIQLGSFQITPNKINNLLNEPPKA